MAELGKALGGRYEIVESEYFQALVPQADYRGCLLVQFAERCRAVLISGLAGVADFGGLGKQIVVALRNRDHYYRYISLYFPEGEHGGSVGVHIREDCPHVALHGKEQWALEYTVAHELTHVSLHHLTMPQWLEEGLAQMFEHQMTSR